MNKKIAIDIGTSSVLIYVKGQGIVLQEPSIITVDNVTNRVIKAGRDSKEMIGRTPDNVSSVYPICDGVINRYTHAIVMLKRFLKRSCGNLVIRPDITICVPCKISDVEEMAFKDAASELGAKNVYFIDSPLACAIGAGIDVMSPEGNMIIDIGGGTTNVAVLSLGGTVEDECVKCGGEDFNDAIIKYVKNRHGVIISDSAAEEAKMKIGTVWPSGQMYRVNVKGRNILTSTPAMVTLTTADMAEAFEEPMTKIAEAVCAVIERTPPELVADIAKKGIYLAGGTSQLHGMNRLISSVTGMTVKLVEKPVSCAVLGAGKADELDLTPHTPKRRFQ